ncbi:ABC-type glycerol-3-phosphate transport system substrate-binding protein [Paenibacillus sp. PastF-1]|nr:ABC-type glycerol-3-phosphate transport system substrate-binding protein [Paenibacillus sp. PastF-2]MDF9850408.1 ABC-type glycerol-3-phosphate transport system substrate-binding protein [Paenibacillus sp. PastM-2]MDF9856889.1 ABC-type glycerol-3-phosphate transport system substrate-binding protein [Paenibacillus sp. PastF-1]MDH6482254.1 ABC-type glycerol-3-phosphate transport system substrate-binding protein [Paenibacillus sp. PastH-2]MDH6509582.1 ABC-type glycerol-3-phosphate transport syst
MTKKISLLLTTLLLLSAVAIGASASADSAAKTSPAGGITLYNHGTGH